jgi:hypothetical protein
MPNAPGREFRVHAPQTETRRQETDKAQGAEGQLKDQLVPPALR